jgi:predicted aspartyl protease
VAAFTFLSAGNPVRAAEPVPMQIRARIPFVTGEVNGRGPFTFIVDTGASETVITPRTASTLSIRTSPVSPRQKTGMVRSISVGDGVLRDFRVYVFDPPQALRLRLDKGIDYHGILGYTFLSAFVTTLDYRAGRMTLVPVHRRGTRDAGSTGAEGVARVPFKLVNRLVHVEGTVNAAARMPFLVDTGSAEVLLLPAVARKLGIASRPLPSPPGAGIASLDRITVGNAVAPNLQAVVHKLPRDPRPTYAGILGTPFLSRFLVTFNYRDRVMLLRQYGRDATSGSNPLQQGRTRWSVSPATR